MVKNKIDSFFTYLFTFFFVFKPQKERWVDLGLYHKSELTRRRGDLLARELALPSFVRGLSYCCPSLNERGKYPLVYLESHRQEQAQRLH